MVAIDIMRLYPLSVIAAGLSLLASTNAALQHISTKGSKFYMSNGEQFFIKGIAYQLDSEDTLLDASQCRLDAALMKKIGANTIRVYHVTEPHDHSGCMKAFEDAGIYVFLDLDTFNSDIDQYSPMWTQSQARAFEAVMDEFQKYDNTAGFFIGNEVLTIPRLSEVAPFVKAATRDLKAYRDSKGYRKIPVGYSHADISALRPHLQNYLACGDNDAESVDFFGLNNYEWCGSNTYVGSNYQNLTRQIMNYPKPIFLSETGCHIPEPRLFQDQTAVFGEEMTPYWSGAIIYEWIQEENHYGLVAYDKQDTNAFVSTETEFPRSGTPLPVSPDFSNLMKVWASATPKSTPAASYTPTARPPDCPAYTANIWEVAGDVVLPSLGETMNNAVRFSITAGHPKGKPHQTAATTTSSSSTASKGGAAALGPPSPLLASRNLFVSGEKTTFGVLLSFGGALLAFAYWL